LSAAKCEKYGLFLEKLHTILRRWRCLDEITRARSGFTEGFGTGKSASVNKKEGKGPGAGMGREGTEKIILILPLFFSRLPKGELVLAQLGELESRKGRLDATATPPAETSCVSSAMPFFTPFFLVTTDEWLAHLF
jgi:hypothetical protein